tara:strand:- start:2785 stop:6657 length:3873 start_codon:yes stop_codon:yes gene_type:complete
MADQQSFQEYANQILDQALKEQSKYKDYEYSLQNLSDKVNQPYESAPQDLEKYYEQAKSLSLGDVTKSKTDKDLYGFIPGDWLPDWVKSGYNNSIEGLTYQVATGKQYFDLSGYEQSNPGILEDIGSGIISFLTPTDIAVVAGGGGLGGYAVRTAAKASAKKAIQSGVKQTLKKGISEEAVDTLVSKNARKATELLMKNNIKKDVAEKVIENASKKVSKKIFEETTKGATGLGFYSGLQSALGQEINSGDVDLVRTLADTTKGAILGGVTAGTGKAFNNRLIGKLGKEGTKSEKTARNIAVKALETAEFGTISPLLEGDMPSIDDYVHAAGTIAGLSVAKAIPKKIQWLAGRENPLLTAKEVSKSMGEVKFETKRKDDIFKSLDNVEISKVEFVTRDGKQSVSGKLVVDGKVTEKTIELSGKEFIDRGFSRKRIKLNSKELETSRRKEIFGRKKNLKLSDREFKDRVKSVASVDIDPKRKTGYGQLTGIEKIKLLDNLRKETYSDKIYKTFKSQGAEDYLLPQRNLTAILNQYPLLLQAKNRARTQLGLKTVNEINKADARSITLSGIWVQELMDKGLYSGGAFKKIFGDSIKKLKNEKTAKQYFEDLGRRLGDKQFQNNRDVKEIRLVLDRIYNTAKNSGVPVAEYRKNYFPDHVKQKYLDIVGSDIFKIINQDISLAGIKIDKSGNMITKLDQIIKSEKSNINPITRKALEALRDQFRKESSTKEEAMAKAWMELRDTVYKQRYSVVGNLEKSRKGKLPEEFYERDARLVLFKYATDVAKRTANVEFFGDKSQVIEQRLTALKKLRSTATGKKRNTLSSEIKWMEQIFDTFTNLIEVDPVKNWGDPRARRIFKDFVDFEVGTKIGLGYATVPNITQTLISTAVKTGYYNTFKGIIKLSLPGDTGKKYRNNIKKSGISNLSVFQMISGLEPSDRFMGRFANFATKISGFQTINKVNQYVSAAAGKEYLSSLMKAKNSKIQGRRNWAKKNLKDLGIDPSTKKLTEKQTLESMYRFSRDAQLQRNVLNDPLFFNDPRFRPFVLFKRFGYKQFNWIRENLSQELSAGNILPILRLGVGGAFGSQFVIWSKKALNNFLAGEEVYDENRLFLPGLPKNTIIDDEDNTDMSQYTWSDFLDQASSVGALGFIGDIAASESKYRAVEFLLKPAIIQDTMKAINALQRTYEDLNNFGFGKDSALRGVKYWSPIFGTVPRRISKRFETEGQRETYTRYRKGIIRGRILDALIAGQSKEATKIINAWNKSNPTEAFLYEDIGVSAIFDRIQKREEKRRKP